MRIVNRTDLDRATIVEVLRFVAPPGVGAYEAEVRAAFDRSPLHGRAYPSEWRVLLRIAPAAFFPYRGHKPPRGGYLGCPPLMDRLEALVFIAAHELRHLWHARVPRGRRVWGARGQFSERDADAYALRMLRAWRRRGLPDRHAVTGSAAALDRYAVAP
jgi:hypothetical protein